MSFLKDIISSMARVFGRVLAYIVIGLIIYLIASKTAKADTPGYIELYDDHVTPAQRILRVEDTDYAEWQISSLSDTTRANRLIVGWRKNVQANKRVYFSFSGTIRYALSQDVSYRELHIYTYDGTNLVEVNANCIDNGTRVNYSGYAYADFKENFSCSFKTTTAINRVHVRWNYYHSDGTNADIQLLHFMQTSNTFSDSENDADSINANNDKNTNAIMENNDQNTYEIIQNQNQNTEDLINALKKDNQTCVDSFQYKYTNGKNLNSSGELITSSGMSTSEFIQIDTDTDIRILAERNASSPSTYICFFSNNTQSSYISCNSLSGLSVGTQITIPTNANYIRTTFKNSSSLPQLMICKNSGVVINEKIDKISNFLTDDSPIDTTQLNNVVGWLPPGPVDSLLLLPLQFLNMLSNVFGSNSCPTINLTFPIIGGSFRLKCLNEIWVGISNFETIVNLLLIPLIGFYLYKTFMSLYSYIREILMLNGGSLISKWKEWGGI